jgi:hypothetical protein
MVPNPKADAAKAEGNELVKLAGAKVPGSKGVRGLYNAAVVKYVCVALSLLLNSSISIGCIKQSLTSAALFCRYWMCTIPQVLCGNQADTKGS